MDCSHDLQGRRNRVLAATAAPACHAASKSSTQVDYQDVLCVKDVAQKQGCTFIGNNRLNGLQ